MQLEVLATYEWFIHQLDNIGKVVHLHILVGIFAVRQHHHYICRQA